MNPISNVSWIFDSLPFVHGGHDGGEGLVGLLDEILSLLSGGFAEARTPFGGLMLLGSNIHPMLVHFPIAFLLVYVIIDVAGLAFGMKNLRRLGSSLLTIGFLGCLFTVAAGLYAAAIVPHGPMAHEIIIWHQRTGIMALVVSGLLTLWRISAGIPEDSMRTTLNQILNVMLLGAIVAAADLGARLVYEQGVAVNSIEKTENGLHQHESAPKKTSISE